MKRNWWILTFTIGVIAAGVVGYRVFSQIENIEKAKIQASIKKLKESTLDENGNEKRKISSSEWRAMANRFGSMLGRDGNDGSVHHKNRDAVAYYQGLSNYNAATTGLREALGEIGGVADPRPETFLNSWDEISQAVSNKNFDIPTTNESAKYQRFKSFVGEDIKTHGIDPVEMRDRVLAEFGLVLTKDPDGDGYHIEEVDEFALARVGVRVEDTVKSDDGMEVIGLKNEFPKHQFEFLMHRLLVLNELQELNGKMIQRFVEMEMPEYTWQFLDVLVEDQKVGPYILRNAFGATIDARRAHLVALRNWSKEPSSDLLFGVLERARQEYQNSLQSLERMVNTGVASAKRAQPKLDWIRERYQSPAIIMNRMMETFIEFDPDAYRESIAIAYEGEKLDYMVEVEKKRVAKRMEEIKSREMPREKAVQDAIDLIARLGSRIQEAGKKRSDIELSVSNKDAEALSELEVYHAFAKSGMSAITEEFENAYGSSDDAGDAFKAALRDVMIADVLVIQERAARMLNDSSTTEELLDTLDGETFGRINRAFSVIVKGIEDIDMDRDGIKIEGDIKTPDRVGESFDFLDTAIQRLQKRADNTQVGDTTNKRLYSEMARELRSLRSSLERASFEHAELSYQVMLSMLSELTGTERPYLPYELADLYGYRHRQWVQEMKAAYEEGRTSDLPEHPMQSMEDESGYEELKRIVEKEIEYRKHFELVRDLYTQFVKSENADIALRAQLGLASAEIDNLEYNWQWKWERANPTPIDNDHPARGYGVYAWVMKDPSYYPKALAENGYEYEGEWLKREDANERRKNGMPRAEFRRVESILEPLRILTPSQAPDIYVAIMLRSGQLRELYTPEPRILAAKAGRYSTVRYNGDLPGAVKDFYLPLLRATSTVTQESLIQNRYIPLETHFRSVNMQLWETMNAVDTNSETELRGLFGYLSETDEDVEELSKISELYGAWLTEVSNRQPGIMDLTDAIYDFNYRLGELADALARLKVEKLEVNSDHEDRVNALKFRDQANGFYRRAGNHMLDYVSRYPHGQGISQRMMRIGNAFYQSGDYIFSIDAYRSYFEARRFLDLDASNANIFFVANRIGEAYMALGLYEGTTLRQARADGDQDAIADQNDLTTMTLDGAIQAFKWASEQTRDLINRKGEGGAPLNTIAPDGGLESFVNLARARVELARLMNDQAAKSALYEKTIEEIDRAFFQDGLFPFGHQDFSSTVYWRDARFVSGVAGVELARLERLKDAPDRFVFKKWLDVAERAFKNIDSEFSDPIDREIFRLAVNEGESFENALDIAGRGAAKFDDDVFYLSLTYAAEVEWLRAVHVKDENRLADEVVENLRSAQSRLEILLEKLKSVQSRERLVGGETISFPDLARQSRYRLADVIYLRARTMRDRELSHFESVENERTRLDPTNPTPFRMTNATRDLYRAAEKAYNEAEEFAPDTYLAVFARAQKLNIYRALSTGSSAEDAVTYKRMAEDLLRRSTTTLAAMPDSAFESAPEGMRRADWEKYFKWYETFDSTTNAPAGS